MFIIEDQRKKVWVGVYTASSHHAQMVLEPIYIIPHLVERHC